MKAVVAVLVFGVALSSWGLGVGIATLLAVVYMLIRLEQMARDLKGAINDQSTGIKTVADRAKAIADNDDDE